MANLYCMHLKRSNRTRRQKMISHCMENHVLALGWSFLYEAKYGYHIHTIQDLVAAARSYYGAEKKPVSTFAKLIPGDLVWTRDLDGVYYICRVLEYPVAQYDGSLDIGATVKVDIRKVGLSVPGTIVHRFSIPRSPTIQRIVTPEYITHYSEELYAHLCGEPIVHTPIQYDLFQLLNGFDLEELVIDYLQITRNYYLSKNSVARNDSTIKVECELYPRDLLSGDPCAVLQVKGGNYGSPDLVQKYRVYVESGKTVFLFFSNENYGEPVEGIEYIRREDLLSFVKTHRRILPPALTHWINLCLPI